MKQSKTQMPICDILHITKKIITINNWVLNSLHSKFENIKNDLNL